MVFSKHYYADIFIPPLDKKTARFPFVIPNLSISLKFSSVPFVNGYLLPKQEDKLFFNVSFSRVHDIEKRISSLLTVEPPNLQARYVHHLFSDNNRTKTIYQCSKPSSGKCETVTNEVSKFDSQTTTGLGRNEGCINQSYR